jgi:hypothetical protein
MNMSKDTEVTQNEQSGEAEGTGNDARLALMNAINDQNDTDRADEMVEFDESGQVTKFKPSDVEGALPTGDTQDVETTEAEMQRMEDETNGRGHDSVEEALGIPKYKIKVNGKEIELTQEEMIARVQKVEAADAYLAEASRIKREAEEYKRAQSQPVPQVDQVDEDAELEAIVNAIQMGNAEEAKAAVKKLKNSAPPAITVDDLNRTVDARLTFNEAKSKFESTYGDILQDPVLRQLALSKDQQQVAQGDKRDYWTRYSEIGNELRAWKEGIVKTGAPEIPPPPAIDPSKQTRKAAAPQAPKAANVKVPAPDVEDEQEETPAAVIAGMAKHRGGPQWMRN